MRKKIFGEKTRRRERKMGNPTINKPQTTFMVPITRGAFISQPAMSHCG